MQALYQIQMTGDAASTVLKQFCESQVTERADVDFFKTLLTDIAAQESELLKIIEPLLDRPLREIDPVEKAILLVGSYEMMHRLEVPFRVVINEGVELAKEFGASDSYRYINSILDGLAKLRETGK
ncbi:MAG TPA: transcription antitermination factor NusB [Gammaproteobacteria bacterium]|nr:transcription antitermination factor NusB [Gammaproteobacteria bacterium]|tara:strand:- start:4286 stop:4663 length:378 start_codon:yes stop_codon:yes gene_type:complete